MGILGCIYKSGKRSVFYTALFGLGFLAGTKATEDARYKVERMENSVYLIDKQTEQRQPITNDFQLGDVEYRLSGMMKEKNSLEKIVRR